MRSRDLAPLGGAAVALLLASAAWAEPTGWYAAWDVGAHWDNGTPAAHSTGLKPNGLEAKWRLHTKTDWAAFGRLGYRFDPNWRAELEVGWRNGSLNSFHGSAAQGPIGGSGEPIGVCRTTSAAGSCDTPRGYSDQLTGMVNLIYDFFPEASFHPFVGGGVGVDYNKARVGGIIRTQAGSGFSSPEFFHAKGNKTHFAWQVLAGATFDLSEQWAVDLTYRGLGSHQTLTSVSIPTGGGAPLQLGDFQHRTWDNTVTIGLRYMFAPPPPPPPAPVAKEFVVYFPFDKYILTPEAQAVVQQAADYARSGATTSVVVVGHTDTSGSNAYNMRLSERRAKAVADALVGAGVAQTGLQVDWKGESDLAVATPDGVKEPLNRRATININF